MKLVKLFSREYSVQYTEASLRSVGPEVRNHVPALLLSQCWLSEPPNETCYADPKEWNSFNHTLTITFAPGASIEGLIDRFHIYGRQYIASATTSSVGALQNLSAHELIERYEQYQKALIVYSSYLWMGYLLNNIYTDQAKTILNTKSISNRDAVEGALLSPSKRTGILELQTTLSQITSPMLSPKQIEDILKNFAWIPCLDIQNSPWTAEDVQSFFLSFKKPTEGISLEIAIKEAVLSPNEQTWFDLVRELVYVKDMRDEYRRRGIWAILPLFDEIARRCGISRQQIAYFTSTEIIDALRNNSTLSPTEAEHRQKGFLIHWKNNQILTTANPQEVQKFRDQFIQRETTTKTLKGTPACSGRATGPVAIVRGISDLTKVQKGDVMVAVTTHPDFVPAMHRAVAIVTDEGGLTSHAAIVARELNIPCIAGTGNATRVLHNGERIRVDATHGTVTVTSL